MNPFAHLDRTKTGRIMAGHPRTIGAGLLSVLIYTLLPGGLSLTTRGVIAWDVGSVVLLISLAVMFLQAHSSEGGGDAAMAYNAERQDEGEWTVFSITILGAVASFAAVTVVLHDVKDMAALERQLHVGLVAATLLLSWFMTHTVFALRYAHEYYARTPGVSPGVTPVDGGLEFPGGSSPDYWDFVYFSFVLGMTFQVSDVQVTSRKLRRLATVHGLLAFLFNTVIVALTVNIAASLL